MSKCQDNESAEAEFALALTRFDVTLNEFHDYILEPVDATLAQMATSVVKALVNIRSVDLVPILLDKCSDGVLMDFSDISL